MKKYTLALLIITLAMVCQAQHQIIPQPVRYESTNDILVLGDQIKLDDKTKNELVGIYLDNFSTYLKGFSISLEKGLKSNQSLKVSLNRKPDQEIGSEGYQLIVNANDISISANDAAGVFNAIQTLRQLLPSVADSTNPIEIQGCSIIDYPRFAWRGLMLDVSRHFFPPEEVKAYIDQMSQYKFNVFHWHLTDDEGWRIEIKSLPKLTEIGAWRVERHGRFGEKRTYPTPDEKATYGGFYTQEQVKDIIKYASERNITIVPEIDMPGHSMAALAAYPELSTLQEPKFVNPGSKFAEWHGNGEFDMLIENMLNPTDEKVYDFAEQVFSELAELFPGEYIHMGGDECDHGYWEKHDGVRRFMKANGIDNAEELQSYFVSRIAKIISSKGKKMIGWDEILQGGLADGAAVMSWRGMKGGIEAAKLGHKAVMSPTTFAYLDYTQGDPSVENRIYASLSLEKTYQFNPVPEGIDSKFILGGQANLWTEAIPNIDFAFYMTYPRAFAISECVWSQEETKNWDNFIGRVEYHFDRFDRTNTNISKAVCDPIVEVKKVDGKLICELNNAMPDTEIYYSIDNTYPVKFGNKYEQPFEIPEGNLSLRTRTYRNGQPLGRVLLIHRDDLVKRVR